MPAFLFEEGSEMKNSTRPMWQVQCIGQTAGEVWHLLQAKGKSSLSAVEWGVHAPKSMVHMAIGWLAREGKLDLVQEKRVIKMWLKDSPGYLP